jgi:hypothetical protein
MAGIRNFASGRGRPKQGRDIADCGNIRLDARRQYPLGPKQGRGRPKQIRLDARRRRNPQYRGLASVFPGLKQDSGVRPYKVQRNT